MPCRVDTTFEDQRELSETTRMLCELCGLCDDMKSSVVPTVPGLKEWWKKHKETDAKRRARLRLEALAKLTADECEALGIKR